MPGVNNRQRHIRFRKPLSAEIVTQIRDRLLEHEHVNRAECDTDLLEVEYRFPLVTLGSIVESIQSCTSADLFTPWQRLGLYFQEMVESNAQDYLYNRYGWQNYLEDIYVHEYESALHQREDVRLQTWRKYKYG